MKGEGRKEEEDGEKLVYFSSFPPNLSPIPSKEFSLVSTSHETKGTLGAIPPKELGFDRETKTGLERPSSSRKGSSQRKERRGGYMDAQMARRKEEEERGKKKKKGGRRYVFLLLSPLSLLPQQCSFPPPPSNRPQLFPPSSQGLFPPPGLALYTVVRVCVRERGGRGGEQAYTTPAVQHSPYARPYRVN